MQIGLRHVGLAETPGKESTPQIQRWLIELKAWWRDDETPWCGVFVAACMRESGLPLPRHWYRALDWMNWGTPIAAPLVGCVVVYQRKGGGHVGIVVGRDRDGNLMTLGGNQGNRVSIAPFPVSRVLGYRWPSGVTMIDSPLPLAHSDGKVSETEA
jgi:uncharacterized protein (TIGR02594 family)